MLKECFVWNTTAGRRCILVLIFSYFVGVFFDGIISSFYDCNCFIFKKIVVLITIVYFVISLGCVIIPTLYYVICDMWTPYEE